MITMLYIFITLLLIGIVLPSNQGPESMLTVLDSNNPFSKSLVFEVQNFRNNLNDYSSKVVDKFSKYKNLLKCTFIVIGLIFSSYTLHYMLYKSTDMSLEHTRTFWESFWEDIGQYLYILLISMISVIIFVYIEQNSAKLIESSKDSGMLNMRQSEYHEVFKVPRDSNYTPLPQQNRIPIGLKWMENNCYIISLMQCLAWMLPEMKDLFAEYKSLVDNIEKLEAEQELLLKNHSENSQKRESKRSQSNKSGFKPQILNYRFLQLMTAMQSGSPVSRDLVMAFTHVLTDGRTSALKRGQQEDPSDVVQALIESLTSNDEEMKAVFSDQVIEYFCTTLSSFRICKDCETSMELDPNDIIIRPPSVFFDSKDDVKIFQDLLQRISLTSSDSEDLLGVCVNEDCQSFGQKVSNFNGILKLSRLPEDVFFCTIRVKFEGGSVRSTSPVIIPVGSLDVIGGNTSSEKRTYNRLEAFVLKRGQNLNSGHYVAYLRAPTGDENAYWYCVDDESVKVVKGYPAELLDQPENYHTTVASVFYR